jgi:hypothetical protein
MSRGVMTDGALVAIASLPSLVVMKFCLVPNAKAVTPMSANTARQSTTRASGDLTILFISSSFCFGSDQAYLNPWFESLAWHCLLPQ